MQKYARYVSRCVLLCALAISISFIITRTSGCNCFDKSGPLIIEASDRIAFLDPNDAAPFRCVCITELRHEYLLDCEEFVVTKGIIP